MYASAYGGGDADEVRNGIDMLQLRDDVTRRLQKQIVCLM